MALITNSFYRRLISSVHNRRTISIVFIIILVIISPLCALRSNIPTAIKLTMIPQLGKGEITLNGIQLYTFTPEGYIKGRSPILFIFHGASKDASNYRDYGVELTKVSTLRNPMVVAPLFPNSLHEYIRGYATWNIITDMIQEVLRVTETTEHYLIGHSAGAQFLTRYIAFQPTTALRVIAMNAGTYAFPARDISWSFGYGNLPNEIDIYARWEQMFSVPLIIDLGTADILQKGEAPGKLDMSEAALRQGQNRLERGRNYMAACKAVAEERGLYFNWELVETPGIGHDAKKMIHAKEMSNILLSADISKSS